MIIHYSDRWNLKWSESKELTFYPFIMTEVSQQTIKFKYYVLSLDKWNGIQKRFYDGRRTPVDTDWTDFIIVRNVLEYIEKR